MPNSKRIVIVRKKGQITIPAEIINQAGIKVGDVLAIDLIDGKMVLQPASFVEDKFPIERKPD